MIDMKLMKSPDNETDVDMRVDSVRMENEDTITLLFDDELPIEPMPGQYVMAGIPGKGTKPLSVSYQSPFGLTVMRVRNPESGEWGEFSSACLDLKPGDSVRISGPKGSSFKDYNSSERYSYLIAGGCGAVPLACFADYIQSQRGGNLPVVLLGANTKDRLLFADRFGKSSETLLLATMDGSDGYKGPVTGLLDDLEPPPQGSQFYICGPIAMSVAAAGAAEKYVDSKDIFLSLDPIMKCGDGVCGSCEVAGLHICRDGPVIPYSALKGAPDFEKYFRTESGKLHPLDR